MSMLDAALGYVESSPARPVFPAFNKLPAIKTGADHANGEHMECSIETVRCWWERDFPNAAIGMPTGAASGTVVIDVDKKHDGETLLSELEHVLGPLPRVRVVRTQSGGLHVY